MKSYLSSFLKFKSYQLIINLDSSPVKEFIPVGFSVYTECLFSGTAILEWRIVIKLHSFIRFFIDIHYISSYICFEAKLFLWTYNIQYTQKIEPMTNQIMILPKSNMMNEWILWGLHPRIWRVTYSSLTDDSDCCIIKSSLQHDGSQRWTGSWSTPHNLKPVL